MISLAGKVCIVTGASRGIGEAIARRFAQEKARLCLVARSGDKLEALAQELGENGEPPLIAVADVTREADVERAAGQALARFGRIDVLINNAGIVQFSYIGKMPESMWDEIVDSNLKGTFLFCKHVVPYMLTRGRGDVVNIASIAAHQGFEASTAYCAAKHGVLGFSRALALEVRKKGLRVITVSPGSVDTPMWEGMEWTPPRAKMLHAEEVAEAVLAALTISPTATVDEIIVMPQEGVL